jgi:hypothetical protein
MKINTNLEIKQILKAGIFGFQNTNSYVFEDTEYAILPGDLSLLIRRNYIDWQNINPRHKYSILQRESDFIFRTYENELCLTENEFIISVYRNENETYTVTFKLLNDNKEWLKLRSD